MTVATPRAQTLDERLRSLVRSIKLKIHQSKGWSRLLAGVLRDHVAVDVQHVTAVLQVHHVCLVI